RHHGKRARVTVGVSTFVPKPHTPFQWAGQATREEIEEKVAILQVGMRDRGLRFSWHDPESSQVEAILSRGDRRVGRAIYEAWRRGARFDAWSDHLSWPAWEAGMRLAGLDVAFYTSRERDVRELLPWDHVDVGVARWHLVAQWRRALGLEPEPRQRQKYVLFEEAERATVRA
ncbi:MAG TPA: B12-binding domain-containing radical SAM protein, partial [Chloroflexota bacterium]|nr:B12-binding domain-containing radical SAM protein [Chloroflexota bacterium]